MQSLPAEVFLRAADSPVAIYQAIHHQCVREVMETASWGAHSEDQVKVIRCVMAHRAATEFFAADVPDSGSLSGVDWVNSQLGNLTAAIVRPDDPIRLWHALRVYAQRRHVPSRQCPCWGIDANLPPR